MSTVAAAAELCGIIHRVLARVTVVRASKTGAAALWALLSWLDFAILLWRETLPGIGLSVLLATAVGVAIVIADLLIRFPEDMNVAVRQALDRHGPYAIEPCLFEKLAHSFLEVGPFRDHSLGIRRANLPKRPATVYDVPIDTV
jgi:hypothetical protein